MHSAHKHVYKEIAQNYFQKYQGTPNYKSSQTKKDASCKETQTQESPSTKESCPKKESSSTKESTKGHKATKKEAKKIDYLFNIYSCCIVKILSHSVGGKLKSSQLYVFLSFGYRFKLLRVAIQTLKLHIYLVRRTYFENKKARAPCTRVFPSNLNPSGTPSTTGPGR
jgi:hypothetical protein